MEQMQRHGQISRAAMMAGMDRKIARRYVVKLPGGRGPAHVGLVTSKIFGA